MNDQIIAAVRFLTSSDNLEWMRHRPECDEFLTDVEAAVRVMRRVAEPNRDRAVIVGMCDCGRILYAPKHRQVVTCPDCEKQWDVDASTDGLREQLDERLVTAAEAAHLGAYLDTDRTSEQIRKLVNKWAGRGLLAKHGDVRIKHKHSDACEAGCTAAADIIDTYRFGDIALRMAQTPRRAARQAEDVRMSA